VIRVVAAFAVGFIWGAVAVYWWLLPGEDTGLTIAPGESVLMTVPLPREIYAPWPSDWRCPQKADAPNGEGR
jgi:hypothetical protein